MPYLSDNPCLGARDRGDERRDEVPVDVGAVDDANHRVVIGAELGRIVVGKQRIWGGEGRDGVADDVQHVAGGSRYRISVNSADGRGTSVSVVS